MLFNLSVSGATVELAVRDQGVGGLLVFVWVLILFSFYVN